MRTKGRDGKTQSHTQHDGKGNTRLGHDFISQMRPQLQLHFMLAPPPALEEIVSTMVKRKGIHRPDARANDQLASQVQLQITPVVPERWLGHGFLDCNKNCQSDQSF
jgi:hypothetical protein